MDSVNNSSEEDDQTSFTIKSDTEAPEVSEHFEFEDKASNKAEFENDISSDREPSANSRVDVDALNGKQDGNYEQNVDAPKGHDYSNSELELIFGNVSVSTSFSRHYLI